MVETTWNRPRYMSNSDYIFNESYSYIVDQSNNEIIATGVGYDGVIIQTQWD